MTQNPDTTASGDEVLREDAPRDEAGRPPVNAPVSTAAGEPVKDPLRSSRTSGLWAAVIGLGIVLILLIIFIAQNTRKTTVSFLAWDGQVSVAVALLIAAVAGMFLAGMAGTLRILQLRRRVRRDRKAHR